MFAEQAHAPQTYEICEFIKANVYIIMKPVFSWSRMYGIEYIKLQAYSFAEQEHAIQRSKPKPCESECAHHSCVAGFLFSINISPNFIFFCRFHYVCFLQRHGQQRETLYCTANSTNRDAGGSTAKCPPMINLCSAVFVMFVFFRGMGNNEMSKLQDRIGFLPQICVDLMYR